MRKAKTTASRKNKGRLGQQEISKILQEVFDLRAEDVLSRSMGAQGTDLIMSEAAREIFPFAPEIKRTEKLNLYKAIEQAEDNGKKEGLEPVVIFRRNNDKWRVILDFKKFVGLIERVVNTGEKV